MAISLLRSINQSSHSLQTANLLVANINLSHNVNYMYGFHISLWKNLVIQLHSEATGPSRNNQELHLWPGMLHTDCPVATADFSCYSFYPCFRIRKPFNFYFLSLPLYFCRLYASDMLLQHLQRSLSTRLLATFVGKVLSSLLLSFLIPAP